MSTILTDEEIVAIARNVLEQKTEDDKPAAWQLAEGVARAVEAAVLDKLAQQAPVAWMCSDPELSLKGYSRFSPSCEGDWNIPVYTHPAPPQADRQRVPDEFDYKHPKAQALIGADARHRIIIDLVWRILEDPRREFTASDMEYWDTLHDKVQEVALAAAPEAPAQASAVDERAAFDRALSTKPEARFWNTTDAMFWAWQARAALAQKGGDA